MAELVTDIDSIINITNYQQLLALNLKILQEFTNNATLKSIRLCLTQLLRKDTQFTKDKSIPLNYCKEEWIKIVKILVSDTSCCSEIIAEKQLLLRELITHHKLTIENCKQLLNSFTSNVTLKRSECVLTVQHILKYANEIGLDKTCPLVSQIISWLYGERDKNEAKTILMHIEPVSPSLIADTCALAVINFLDDSILKPKNVFIKNKIDLLQLLQFKYNRKFVCLEWHGKESKYMQQKQLQQTMSEQKNCLFQSNYELLMRTVNFETSKGTTCKDIICDLHSLLKICLLMKSLLEFEVFDESTIMQCPLIKRIGFFLSHLEVICLIKNYLQLL